MSMKDIINWIKLITIVTVVGSCLFSSKVQGSLKLRSNDVQTMSPVIEVEMNESDFINKLIDRRDAIKEDWKPASDKIFTAFCH